MKTKYSTQKNPALTRMDVAVILALLFASLIFVAMLLPALAAPRRHSNNWCPNNLKQIAMSLQLWSGDNNDKLPMEVSVTNGGGNGTGRGWQCRRSFSSPVE